MGKETLWPKRRVFDVSGHNQPSAMLC